MVQPDEVAGLILWLDAGLSSLFQNSNGTTAATADTDPVGYWEDMSGSGNHAIQATAAARPTLQTNEINTTLPAIQGDGVNDILVSAVTTSAAMSMFVVARKLSAPSTSSKAVTAFSGGAEVYTNSNDAGNQWAYFGINTFDVHGMGGTPTDWSLYELHYASTSSLTTWMNGSANSAVNPRDEYSTNDELTLFSDGGVGFGDYQIAAVVLYDNKLSSTDRSAIYDYLNNRYFVAGGTPGDVSAVASTVAFAGVAPAVTAAATIAPPVATVAYSAKVPAVAGDTAVTAAASSVAFAALAPTVTAAAAVAGVVSTVAFAAQVPDVAGSGTANVDAETATAVFTGQAPAVSAAATVAGEAASVAYSAKAPTVAGDTAVTAAAASVTWSALAPSVTAAVNVAGALATVAFTAQAPLVTGDGAGTVAAETATAAFSGKAPTVTAAAVVTGEVMTVSLAMLAPSVSAAATVAGAVAGSTWAAQSPQVGGQGAVAAAAGAVTWSMLQPSVTAAANVSAALASSLWMFPTPAVQSAETASIALTARARSLAGTTRTRPLALTVSSSGTRA